MKGLLSALSLFLPIPFPFRLNIDLLRNKLGFVSVCPNVIRARSLFRINQDLVTHAMGGENRAWKRSDFKFAIFRSLIILTNERTNERTNEQRGRPCGLGMEDALKKTYPQQLALHFDLERSLLDFLQRTNKLRRPVLSFRALLSRRKEIP